MSCGFEGKSCSQRWAMHPQFIVVNLLVIRTVAHGADRLQVLLHDA